MDPCRLCQTAPSFTVLVLLLSTAILCHATTPLSSTMEVTAGPTIPGTMEVTTDVPSTAGQTMASTMEVTTNEPSTAGQTMASTSPTDITTAQQTDVVTSVPSTASMTTTITSPTDNTTDQSSTTDQTSVGPSTSTVLPTTEAPTSVMVTSYNETSITVEWSPMDNDTEFYTINATCNDVNETECTDGVELVDGTESSGTVTNLTAGAEYRVIVTAYHTNELESPYDPVVQRTVPFPPRVDEIETYSTTSINVTWTAPPGIVSGYSIIYSSNDDGTDTTISAGPDDTSVLLTPLTPGDTYNITLHSVSGDETSVASNTVHQTTVPEAPSEVDITGYTETTMTVKWTPPDGNVFTNFHINYTSHHSSMTKTKIEDEDKTESELEGLTPGDTYTVTVQTVSGDEASIPSGGKSQTTVPEAPTIVEITGDTETTMTVKWTPPDGNVFTNFHINYTPHSTPTTKTKIEDEHKTESELEDLIPGDTYTVTVETVSGSETSEPSDEQLHTTVPLQASPDRDDDAVTNVTIGVKWRSPNEGNGVTEKYVIACSDGGRASPPEVEYSPTNEMTANCTNLEIPGRSYTITVTSESNNVQSAGVSQDINTIPKEASPKQDNSQVTKSAIGVSWTDPTNGDGEIEEYNVHCDDGTPDPETVPHSNNGEMTAKCKDLPVPGREYSISVTSVSGDSMSAAVPTDINTRPGTPTITVTDVDKNSISLKWTPLQNSEQDDYIVSYTDNKHLNKTEITQDTEMTLTGLNDGETYDISVRARSGTSVGDPDRKSVKTDPDNWWIGLIIGLLLIALIAAVIVLGYLYYKRYYQPSHSKSETLNGIENVVFSSELAMMRPEPREPSKDSLPIKLADYDKYYEEICAEGDDRIEEDYEELGLVGQDNTWVASEIPQNKAKNRYINILPFDRTRVRLSKVDDQDVTDYINANWMPGYNSPKEFIASQGPIPESIDDFWRMIWELDVKTIVMVTRCQEGEKEKCEHYWPYDNEPVLYNDISVNIVEEEQLPEWIITELCLQKDDVVKQVRHFNFTSWPDHDVPEETEPLLEFVRLVRSQMPNDDTPTVVHCSAGVGRTGTFIALDTLIQHMRDHDYVDIYGIAYKMREHRSFMIQTESQYFFIHECVYDLLHENDPSEKDEEEESPAALDHHTYSNVPLIPKVKENGGVSTGGRDGDNEEGKDDEEEEEEWEDSDDEATKDGVKNPPSEQNSTHVYDNVPGTDIVGNGGGTMNSFFNEV
ncbi:receptor-type tyrosine-protein phosphatase H-like isoform X2 [Ptychodera flava]|uniref:receptor-type tyrosine-protein phosphatase H-like isoform X2 n=1 Tax=Ptychodera flava TaxID=63121 RepID=UPI00396A04FB